MLATVINVILVLVGSFIGLLFKNIISDRFLSILTHALGLCVLGIGISGLIGTENMLCVIICMVLGTLIGEWIDIERRLESAGNWLRSKVSKGDGENRFTESFVNAFLLFCVGAMTITGAIDAGLNGDYSTIISKSVLDGVTSISFAATMGMGVAFSVIPLFLYQGAITLLAGWVGPHLPPAVINEMSAVGSALIVGIAINMLGLPKTKIKVGNMLPAMFLPIAYIPIANWLSGLL